MRQLKDLITHSFSLEPLVRNDIDSYLDFRMRAAGYRGPKLFSAAAVKLIAYASLGLTRRINILADKSLLAAFAANTHQILPRHIHAAIRDAEYANFNPSRVRIWAGLAASILALLLGILVFRDNRLESLPPSALPAPQPASPASVAVLPVLDAPIAVSNAKQKPAQPAALNPRSPQQASDPAAGLGQQTRARFDATRLVENSA